MKHSCPLCDGEDLIPVIDRSDVPVFQNAIYRTIVDARSANTGRLAIRTCAGCGFVFNADFESDLVMYGADYENDQTVSPSFAAHVDRMADQVLSSVSSIERPVVLEVGCGQGYFLERLAARSPRPLAGALGFDPAWRGTETKAPIRIQARLFDADAAAEIADPISVIASRHVIEHVDNPIGFLRAIRAALKPGAEVTLFLETPCVEWILRNGVLQDFFYEHCSYFTTRTLAYALERAGWKVGQVGHVFDGQYLWASASPDWSGAVAERPIATDIADLSRSFADRVRRSIDEWRETIVEKKRDGGIALWGAAAKGVTFAATVDPETSSIDCLIDVNPRKQGGYTAVTGHPIVSPVEASRRGVVTALVMNPNYSAEIAAQVRRDALPFDLMDG